MGNCFSRRDQTNHFLTEQELWELLININETPPQAPELSGDDDNAMNSSSFEAVPKAMVGETEKEEVDAAVEENGKEGEENKKVEGKKEEDEKKAVEENKEVDEGVQVDDFTLPPKPKHLDAAPKIEEEEEDDEQDVMAKKEDDDEEPNSCSAEAVPKAMVGETEKEEVDAAVEENGKEGEENKKVEGKKEEDEKKAVEENKEVDEGVQVDDFTLPPKPKHLDAAPKIEEEEEDDEQDVMAKKEDDDEEPNSCSAGSPLLNEFCPDHYSSPILNLGNNQLMEDSQATQLCLPHEHWYQCFLATTSGTGMSSTLAQCCVVCAYVAGTSLELQEDWFQLSGGAQPKYPNPPFPSTPRATCITYHKLVTEKDRLGPEVDREQLELYMTNEEFFATFSMNKEAWGQLPLWRKIQIKKQKKLF